MDKIKLPPLNQLRVFESAARHLSFKAAAEELCVTAPAISHQLKQLEEYLAVKLFTRLNRQVRLTKEGKAYADQITKAFQLFESATTQLLNGADRPQFVINCLPSFSSLLMVPNIHEFQSLYPDVNLQLVSDTSRASFENNDVDVAIRHQLGHEPELEYVYLSTVSISPICSPSFFKAHPELADSDLSQSRLIHVTVGPDNWDIWLSQWGIERPTDELSLNSFHASLEATKNSVGVAMGYVPLVRKLVNRDELVMPMADKISHTGKMYLVSKKSNVDKDIFQAFQIWMVDLMSREWPDK
jgi:LysR family glycine cleavage system transcriptional activator